MSGRIIPLHDDQHRETQLMLPWYLAGRLEASDLDRVKAHLDQCPDCQAELNYERRLKSEIVDLPLDVEQGWRRLQERLRAEPQRRAHGAAVGIWLRSALRGLASWWRFGSPWLGWAVAAPAILLLVVGAPAPRGRPARYQTLGATPAPAAGDVVVIFRPETRESDLRAALRASDARVVDGPTASDAYVLHVPIAERVSALAGLRRRPVVVLAEPIDSGKAS